MKYEVTKERSYSAKLSHYSSDPMAIMALAIKFLQEGFFREKDSFDLQHVFFWKKGRRGLPLILENDQSLSQFLTSYLGVKTAQAEKMKRLFFSLYGFSNLKSIIVWSRWAKQGFIKDGFEEDKVKVIPPPINIPDKKSRIESKRIIFVGRDFIRKGGDIAIKIFLDLSKRFRDVEMCYIGKIEDEMLLAKAAATGRFIHYENPDDNILYNELFPSSSIFLLPTRSEAFGMSIMEAMSYSMPVVTSDLPPIKENITSYRNGITVEDGDIAGYEDAMAYLLESEDARRRIGSNARTFVNEKFSPVRIAEELKKLYMQSLG